jgi:small subunit ribosomal protein S2
MPKLPELVDMLHAGMHFGHRATRWHPKIKPYLFGERQGIHVFNLELTQQKLGEALDFVKQMAAQNKQVVFVGTKRQAQAIVKREAERCGMPYITERWIGGLVTNFEEIGKRLEQYRKMIVDRENGGWDKYTKKERVVLEDEFQKKHKMFSGLTALKRMPDSMFFVDIRTEKTGVTETLVKKIPTLAITDTNVNPELVTYAIPSNDDAVKAIELVTMLLADAILEGKALVPATAKEEGRAPREEKPAQVINRQ